MSAIIVSIASAVIRSVPAKEAKTKVWHLRNSTSRILQLQRRCASQTEPAFRYWLTYLLTYFLTFDS